MRRRVAGTVAVLSLVWTACSSASPAPTTTTPTTAAPPTSVVAGGSTTTTETPGVAPSGLRTRKQGVLIVGTERLEPPWYIGPNADLISGGFEYDIAAELARRLGVPAVKVVSTALVLMMGGQDCKCDIMLSGITITDGRARTLDLSEPYLSTDQGVLVRKGTAITTPIEAAALRWGLALHNATGLDLLQTRVKPTIEPDVVVNQDEAIQRLRAGRDDAVLMDTPEAIAIANANPGLAVAGQYKTGEQYSVALSLGSPNTAIINDAMRDMRGDGTIDTLLRAYFGVDPAKLPALSP
jgi:polar amino acid transport system substrate-binding protein